MWLLSLYNSSTDMQPKVYEKKIYDLSSPCMKIIKGPRGIKQSQASTKNIPPPRHRTWSNLGEWHIAKSIIVTHTQLLKHMDTLVTMAFKQISLYEITGFFSNPFLHIKSLKLKLDFCKQAGKKWIKPQKTPLQT